MTHKIILIDNSILVWACQQTHTESLFKLSSMMNGLKNNSIYSLFHFKRAQGH